MIATAPEREAVDHPKKLLVQVVLISYLKRVALAWAEIATIR